MTAPIQRHKVPKQLAGYRLLSKLGQGAMAGVFKAHHAALDRLVALKVLAPAQGQDGRLRERFLAEGRAAARVSHPNVIACFDLGEAEGHSYLALELAEHGDALRAARACGGALPERQALLWLRDCARGLGAIHAAGLLHRDIKPANILVGGDGAKLSDFGVAKDLRRGDSGTHLVGTPAFMAPEQARGDAADPRSDLYALGCAFFQLITGRLPFGEASSRDILRLIAEGHAPELGFAAQATPATARLIRRAAAADPARRHASAGELLAEVEALVGGERAALAFAEGPGGDGRALIRCPF